MKQYFVLITSALTVLESLLSKKVILVKHPVQNGAGEGIKEMALKISELRLWILQFRNNYRVNFLRLVGTEKRKSR